MSKAEELLKLAASVKCKGVKTIQDINKQYKYVDETPPKGKDDDYVACGQNGNYNELLYIYQTYLEKHIKSGLFTEEDAVKALCETCAELRWPRKRETFYKILSKKLNISIP